MVLAELVFVIVLTGEGLGVVLAEEVLMALPSWTHKSVVAAPCGRSIALLRLSGGFMVVSLTNPQWPLKCSGSSSSLKRFPRNLH